MKTIEIKKSKGLKGEIVPPPDKSVSHRAIMFASMAEGRSRVSNFLRAEDPLSTVGAFRALGVNIADNGLDELVIEGKGLNGFTEPNDVMDCGNSGTTIRLISGLLAGNPFFSVLTGDDSLKKRPMARVIDPLRKMGATISARNGDKYPPIAIRGGGLKAIDYPMPMASAQVKSCLILAGLYADGTTKITEPQKSRDHTERMLAAMGADITVDGLTISVRRGRRLAALDMCAPADFSSAAFFMAAALIVPDSEVVIKGVGVNPGRTGMLRVLKDMGASVSIENFREVSGEPIADIVCSTVGRLKATRIGRELIPSLIDEFPVICILASLAEGVTQIRGAEELRAKESDRIKAMAVELSKLGVSITEYPDGIDITGVEELGGSEIDSYGDHRIAMSFSIAGLVSKTGMLIRDASCVDISFPGFYEKLQELETW
jgi:3-phosphoshikimate 1-carboxyvinyltransferase